MAQFIGSNDDIEVNGQTILSVVNKVDYFADIPLKILKENGIENLDSGKWYSQQRWLDSFKVLAERLGEMALYQIGRRVPENSDWPSDINNIKDALASIDIAYHMNHRKDGELLFDMDTKEKTEGIGNYNFADIGENKVKIVCNNPYPCDFDMGIIESVANMFKPKDTAVKITHENSECCRKIGGESCTYIVEWN